IVYQIQTTFSLSGLIISKIKRIPLIYEVNSLLEYEKEKTFFNSIIIKIAKFTEKQTVKQASKITVVTPELKQIFHDEYKIPLHKIDVVPNGADIDLFYPMDKLKCREELNLAQNKFIVCFVGGLGMGCGAKNIVEAAPYILEQVPNTHFLIVGDGPYRAIMEEKIKSLSLRDNFIFIGAVPHEVVPKYINASDICIALFTGERIKEVGGGSTIKLYEYMACSKPVIGTLGLSTFEILTKYKSGIITNSENSQDISKSILYLLENEKFREDLGINGRQLVETKYNWDVITEQVARICEEGMKNG
ncbi:MAG: glycosyltransferase family 4 protein, partial [ANME-2 cluster archaeon]|nr:glycosyltransferase family 4 protein [ANME-2 cluster archaeon]